MGEKKRQVSDFLDFDSLKNTAALLHADPKSKLIANYITIAIYTGLRVSDILQLTWEQLRKDRIYWEEKKTGKTKLMDIHTEIHKIIKDEYKGSPFITRKNTIITTMHLNRLLKEVFCKEVKAGLHISTHTLRKSFGRRFYSKNNESESALVYLSEIYNHSDLRQTRKYLGIRQEEIRKLIMDL